MDRKLKLCSGCNTMKVIWKAKTKEHGMLCKDCYHKPKVGDTFKEEEISYDTNGAPYHKEFRIAAVIPLEAIKHKYKVNATKSKDSLSELLKLAVLVFNRWIRQRDSFGGTYFKCISCGQLNMIEWADCGHYMPSTYSKLRFNEDNCHAECQTCNRMDDKHLIGYRKNLAIKIGWAKVEWLESHKIGEHHQWDKQELLDIIKKYK